MTAPRLTMTGIHKRFGPTYALRGVDVHVQPGEVLALVGENGAGKSSLVKILSGAEKADSGAMLLDGETYKPRNPLDARRRGVVMVYQELTLAAHLSVEANITLGQESQRFGFIRGHHDREKVRAILDLLQHPEIRPESAVHELSPAAQQLVEIARALLSDARVLILDEPTSALNDHDAQHLFAIMRRLRERGVSLVYISHFLEEIEQIADRVTVLRDGQSVGSGPLRDFTRERIIELMVGRSLREQYPRAPHSLGAPVLEIRNLRGVELPRDATLTLHRGEILGLAGIIGAGRTELLRSLFGLDRVVSGQVIVKSVMTPRASPRQRIAQGFGMLSEDRKSEGLSLTQSIADNLTASRLHPYSRLGWLDLHQRRQAVTDWLTRLGVRFRDPDQPVGNLSGGNQQKVALGRLLHQQADILLLDEPTRGVDIGSKAEIYRLIGELAAQGKAILFVSSYLPELLGVCDNLAVMTRGRLSAPRPVQEWTAEQVMHHATGGA